MSTTVLVLIAVAVWVGALLFAWAMCRAAARGERDPYDNDEREGN